MARDVVRCFTREVTRGRRDLLERAPAAGRRHRAYGRFVTPDAPHLGGVGAQDPRRVGAQARLDRARTDRVDRDAARRVRDGQLPRQADHAVLGRGARRAPAGADESRDRGDIDDTPGPAREHRGERSLAAEEAPGEVDADDALPERGRHALGGLVAVEDPRRVAHDPQGAELANRRRDRSIHVVPAARVTCTNVARPPFDAIAATVSLPPSGSRSKIAIGAPWAASAWAMARPIPEPPPVTNALPPRRFTRRRTPRSPALPTPASRAGSCGPRAGGAARRP